MNLENNFNPYGFALQNWVWLPADLGVKTSAEDQDVEYVTLSVPLRRMTNAIEVATAFLKIMQKAGVKVGILGAEEADSGDAALRVVTNIFPRPVTQTWDFHNYGVRDRRICPHDYKVIKKEYKKFAAVGKGSDGELLKHDFEVFHHTEVINDLIKNGKISRNASIRHHIS